MTSQGEHSQLVLEEESNLENTDDTCCPRRRCPRVLVFFIALYLVVLVVFLTLAVHMRKQSAYPHVIFIIVDDLGWNDVEWSDPDMRTPTLKALYENGVFLNNSYAHPLDSPSRASIFTGMYPYHMGLQHERMYPSTPTYLPKNFTLLPEHLQTLGYKTHLLGKWHLGFCHWNYTPTRRGFDSFTGFYTDDLDYYTHRDLTGNFYDFRTGDMVNHQADGIHTTAVIADKAIDVIRHHEVDDPLFLVMSFQAVHSPVKAPSAYRNETCAHINDTVRADLCALMAFVDDAIANVTSKLREKDMLRHAIVIMTSDNGGKKADGSSNGVFRGEHGDLYEGGTRVASLVSSEYLNKHGYTYSGLFHQVDWFPTVLSLTGTPIPQGLDGLNQWHALSSDGPCPRSEIVYNIDETYKNAAIRVDDFKLIEGSPNYSHPNNTQQPQMYDLSADPGEMNNLIETMPKRYEYLKKRLETKRKSLVRAVDKAKDPKSDPSLFNNVWSPGWC